MKEGGREGARVREEGVRDGGREARRGGSEGSREGGKKGETDKEKEHKQQIKMH